MNYKKIYDKIIENRLNNPLDEMEYGENHHIIPRSLGGSDEVQNLVRLTAREHFICHALLAEMYEKETFEWYKMNLAFKMMKSTSSDHGGNRYFNSRLYELKKKDFSKVMSYAQTGKKNSQYGKVWIYNLDLEQSIKVYKSELDSYLENGWVNGRVLDFDRYLNLKIKRKINNSIKENTYRKEKEKYTKLFNQFLKLDCCISIQDFHKYIDYPYTVTNLCSKFRKYVKEYNATSKVSYKLNRKGD
jgi:hypothetical protein